MENVHQHKERILIKNLKYFSRLLLSTETHLKEL